MLPRKMASFEAPKLIKHLVSLQGEDRRLRFGGTVSDDYIASYAKNSLIDSENNQWFVCGENDIVAACHIALDKEEAELGCSVDKEFRGLGLAQLMFDRAVLWMRTKGIREVFMHCLTENQIMKHIARKNDMTIVSSSGESDANVEIEPATPITVFEDAYMDRMAIYDMFVKTNYNAFQFYWNRNNRGE